MKSYFFVPSDKEKFLRKVPELRAGSFIYDFEESLPQKDFHRALRNVEEVVNPDIDFARPRLFDDLGKLELGWIKEIVQIGFRKLVLPKVTEAAHLTALSGILPERDTLLEVILLVEHPKALLGLDLLLGSCPFKCIGVGLGSHDYAAQIGMKHTLENLYYPRMTLLNMARCHGVEAIDFASLNVDDDKAFRLDIGSGFEMGFDGKFIIHPFQLRVLNEHEYFTAEEIAEAKNVLKHYSLCAPGCFTIVKLDGNVYETPHIRRFLKIIAWAERHESK